jgi:hypothetical protein
MSLKFHPQSLKYLKRIMKIINPIHLHLITSSFINFNLITLYHILTFYNYHLSVDEPLNYLVCVFKNLIKLIDFYSCVIGCEFAKVAQKYC